MADYGLKINQKPHHKVMRHGGNVMRKLRGITIAVVVLLLLLGSAAFILSYLSSQNSKPVHEITITPRQKSKGPTQTAPDTRVGVAIRNLTDTVKRGENAAMMVHTNTDAKCTITVIYDALNTDNTKNITAHDSGLVTRHADEFGLVSWSWTVPASAPVGKATATALCANQKYSGMFVGNILIK